MQEETELMKRIRAAVGAQPGVRLFRNNTGTGWQGKVKTYPNRYVEITEARPLHAGLVTGGSDLIGWREVTVTPEMVGRRIAVFTAVEVKTTTGGKGSEAQRNFLAAVHHAGGFAGIVRTPAEAESLLQLPARGAE